MTQRNDTLPGVGPQESSGQSALDASEDRLPLFIFEPHEAARRRAENASKSAGYQPVLAATTDQATAALEGAHLSGLLLADGAAAAEIGQYVREFTSIDAPMAVVVDSEEVDPAGRAAATYADTYLRRPVTAAALELFLNLGGQLLQARRDKAAEAGEPKPMATRTGFHHFDAVKDLLVVEVRRAKRYGYPLSILLVRLDPIPALQQIDRPDLPREITAGLGVAIARSIRVIDLPIHYADDSILVFLPHTDLAGAEEVGRRVKRRIKRITYRDDELLCQLTASVGVAGISAGDNLSFAKLIKNAASALRAAQLKGGDRVMKRTSGRGTVPSGQILPVATSEVGQLVVPPAEEGQGASEAGNGEAVQGEGSTPAAFDDTTPSVTDASPDEGLVEDGLDDVGSDDGDGRVDEIAVDDDLEDGPATMPMKKLATIEAPAAEDVEHAGAVDLGATLDNISLDPAALDAEAAALDAERDTKAIALDDD